MSGYRKKLIEVALPLEAINAEGAQRKRKAPKGYPTQIHTWWAQRPLAAARGVLFAQLVDDPSSLPEAFPDEAAQLAERQRLFRVMEELIKWEESNEPAPINAARLEIARSHARSSSSEMASLILNKSVSPDLVNNYIATEMPPLCDPFAGGATIPLEAQRLGLAALGSDLNPVAVLINRSLIQAPQVFPGMPPTSPNAERALSWTGAMGLAEDVRKYGEWVFQQAKNRVGHYFPEIALTTGGAGQPKTKDTPKSRPVTAWLWARTVESPNPAYKGVHVPLMSTFWLCTKPGREMWLNPVVDDATGTWRLELRSGRAAVPSAASTGTRTGKAQDFFCLLSKTPIAREYVREQGKAGKLGQRMIAIVTEGGRGLGRIYLPVTRTATEAAKAAEQEKLVAEARESFLAGGIPSRAMITGGVCSAYGLSTWGDLFTSRQIVALVTFSDLIPQAAEKAAEDARSAGVSTDVRRLVEGGRGHRAYGDAVALYLAAALSRVADYGSTLATWRPKDNAMRSSLPRQAFAMTWDFAEGNPFGDSSSGWLEAVNVVANCLEGPAIPSLGSPLASVSQSDARTLNLSVSEVIVSTDPPYYDNISYAELSDFFYTWLRRTLRDAFPDDTRTVLVPKTAELVAASSRHGNKEAAELFFEDGITTALHQLAKKATAEYPATIYYAFKQAENEDGGTSSTGWEKFLEGVIRSGFTIVGTWPLRTEGDNRQNAVGTNALASSVVLVCRLRHSDAESISRATFKRTLRKELSAALVALQQSNIAPVDLAQASIGPGMAIFSRHKHVLEADGKPMTVRSALQLINEVLDEYLASGEGDFDAYTRFAITWYEQHGWDPGPFGEAETLAKARNVAVSGVVEAGICKSAAGKVRILKRDEMRPIDYDPAADQIPTVWEFTQHLIRNLESEGEEAAAYLLKKLGPAADATRELAYRLYNTCERRKWAEDARSYNGLILAWPELEKLVTQLGNEPPPPPRSTEKTAPKKGAAKRKNTRQQSLFDDEDS